MVMLHIFLHNYFRGTEIYLSNNHETNRGKIRNYLFIMQMLRKIH